ncbi:TPA: DUF645 family protein, partial [Vibrio cholerae]
MLLDVQRGQLSFTKYSIITV